MLQYKNLTLIGTSHIAAESIREVKRVIAEVKPEVVALELDALRLPSILEEKKKKLHLSDITKFGVKGFLFNLMGAYVEKKLGEVVNVKPGSEMKAAFYAARKIDAQVALVDQDIRKTMRRLSEEITWREKFRFLWEILKAVFIRERVKIDLSKVPDRELINKLTSELSKKYPSVYKVLILERNEVMAKNLYNIMQDHSVVAVVGAGHEEEIVELVKKRWNGQKKN